MAVSGSALLVGRGMAKVCSSYSRWSEWRVPTEDLTWSGMHGSQGLGYRPTGGMGVANLHAGGSDL